MKARVYHLLYQNRNFIQFIYALIIGNVIALILESYEPIYLKFHSFFYWFEVLSVLIFTLEYIGRIWVINLKGAKRSKFIFSVFGIIDLLAILPFYLPMVFPFDLRIVRILRLFRLLRIFKLSRFSKSFKTIKKVLNETKTELMITGFVCAILLVLSSTLMYYCESEVQPEKFKNIGQAMWWAVATLTTVGYGDVYPVTNVGKFLSAIIALIGIGIVALPTGIISSAFIEKIQSDKAKDIKVCVCPKCGNKFEV